MATTRRLAVTLAAAVLAACGGTRPLPGGAGCGQPEDSDIYTPLDGQSVLSGLESTSRIEIPSLGAPGSELNYLAISGGGAGGAFGAGFLNGWQKTLPAFQVVTGVSAGAILATHAFIGNVEPLSVFGNIEESDLVSQNLLPLVLTPAWYSNKPLRNLMDGLLTPSVLQAVATRAAAGLLAVGVVNLDTGEFVSVNLTRIARLYADAVDDVDRRRYRQWYVDAVIASAAIPLAMPPSYLSCNMMMDGGLRSQVYLLDTAAAIQAASHGSTLNVYALMNGTIELHLGESGDASPAKPSVGDIGTRSVKIFLNASLNNDLHRICTGPLADRIAMISMDQLAPATLNGCRLLEKGPFDGDYMSCVYDAGLALALAGGIESPQRCPAR